MSLPAAWALAASVRRGELSPSEVVEAALARTDLLVGHEGVGAFLSVDAEGARRAAARVSARLAAGEDLPLAGVPFAVKDNIAVAGQPLRCASLSRGEELAEHSAIAVQRLEQAGAIPLGRTNMDELAMGSSTERSAFFSCLNPWDPDRVPGGSSGGSAAAVALGAVPLALGSDTGGSLRQPAAFCGVAAWLPTAGRVARDGLVPLAPSMDTIGPMARCVRDLGLAMAALSEPGPDLGPAPALQGCTIGVLIDCFGRGVQPAVRSRINEGLAALEARGIRLRPVSAAAMDRALRAYQDLCAFELVMHLQPVDAHGPEVRRRLALGMSLSTGSAGADRLALARAVRADLTSQLHALLQSCDALALPVAETVAFRVGERLDDPAEMTRSDALVVPASLAGLPAIVVPVGLADLGMGDRMPTALQLIGRPWQDELLIEMAAVVEEAIPPLLPPHPRLGPGL